MSHDNVFEATGSLPNSGRSIQTAPRTEELPFLSSVDRQLVVDRVYGASDESIRARWELILTRDECQVGARRFDCERLIERATKRLPSGNRNTVTGFTDWIYGLYGIQRKTQAMMKGIAAEALIHGARIPKLENSGWDLIHCGLALPNEPVSKLPRKDFFVSSLAVDGQPLRASPDYVFRERSTTQHSTARGTERIVIVEIKNTAVPVPVDLWPNVRAQLWAYSKIDDFIHASQVILVGEIWGKGGTPGLRRSVTWLRDDSMLEDECSQLFRVYLSLLSQVGRLSRREID